MVRCGMWRSLGGCCRRRWREKALFAQNQTGSTHLVEVQWTEVAALGGTRRLGHASVYEQGGGGYEQGIHGLLG